MGVNFKKLPWGKIAKVGAGIADTFVPGVGAAIRAAESIVGADGPTKLEKASGVTDAFLPLALELTSTEAALPSIQRAKVDVIEAVVAVENAKAELEGAKAALDAAVQAVKLARKASADGTGHP
jgi:hypothetical protein